MEIDNPERGQPFKTWAREQLAEIIFRKDVGIKLVDIDCHSRIVDRVCVDEMDANNTAGVSSYGQLAPVLYPQFCNFLKNIMTQGVLNPILTIA